MPALIPRKRKAYPRMPCKRSASAERLPDSRGDGFGKLGSATREYRATVPQLRRSRLQRTGRHGSTRPGELLTVHQVLSGRGHRPGHLAVAPAGRWRPPTTGTRIGPWADAGCWPIRIAWPRDVRGHGRPPNPAGPDREEANGASGSRKPGRRLLSSAASSEIRSVIHRRSTRASTMQPGRPWPLATRSAIKVLHRGRPEQGTTGARAEESGEVGGLHKSDDAGEL